MIPVCNCVPFRGAPVNPRLRPRLVQNAVHSFALQSVSPLVLLRSPSRCGTVLDRLFPWWHSFPVLRTAAAYVHTCACRCSCTIGPTISMPLASRSPPFCVGLLQLWASAHPCVCWVASAMGVAHCLSVCLVRSLQPSKLCGQFFQQVVPFTSVSGRQGAFCPRHMFWRVDVGDQGKCVFDAVYFGLSQFRSVGDQPPKPLVRSFCLRHAAWCVFL